MTHLTSSNLLENVNDTHRNKIEESMATTKASDEFY